MSLQRMVTRESPESLLVNLTSQAEKYQTTINALSAGGSQSEASQELVGRCQEFIIYCCNTYLNTSSYSVNFKKRLSGILFTLLDNTAAHLMTIGFSPKYLKKYATCLKLLHKHEVLAERAKSHQMVLGRLALVTEYVPFLRYMSWSAENTPGIISTLLTSPLMTEKNYKKFSQGYWLLNKCIQKGIGSSQVDALRKALNFSCNIAKIQCMKNWSEANSHSGKPENHFQAIANYLSQHNDIIDMLIKVFEKDPTKKQDMIEMINHKYSLYSKLIQSATPQSNTESLVKASLSVIHAPALDSSHYELKMNSIFRVFLLQPLSHDELAQLMNLCHTVIAEYLQRTSQFPITSPSLLQGISVYLILQIYLNEMFFQEIDKTRFLQIQRSSNPDTLLNSMLYGQPKIEALIRLVLEEAISPETLAFFKKDTMQILVSLLDVPNKSAQQLIKIIKSTIKDFSKSHHKVLAARHVWDVKCTNLLITEENIESAIALSQELTEAANAPQLSTNDILHLCRLNININMGLCRLYEGKAVERLPFVETIQKCISLANIDIFNIAFFTQVRAHSILLAEVLPNHLKEIAKKMFAHPFDGNPKTAFQAYCYFSELMEKTSLVQSGLPLPSYDNQSLEEVRFMMSQDILQRMETIIQLKKEKLTFPDEISELTHIITFMDMFISLLPYVPLDPETADSLITLELDHIQQLIFLNDKNYTLESDQLSCLISLSLTRAMTLDGAVDDSINIDEILLSVVNAMLFAGDETKTRELATVLGDTDLEILKFKVSIENEILNYNIEELNNLLSVCSRIQKNTLDIEPPIPVFLPNMTKKDFITYEKLRILSDQIQELHREYLDKINELQILLSTTIPDLIDDSTALLEIISLDNSSDNEEILEDLASQVTQFNQTHPSLTDVINTFEQIHLAIREKTSLIHKKLENYHLKEQIYRQENIKRNDLAKLRLMVTATTISLPEPERETSQASETIQSEPVSLPRISTQAKKKTASRKKNKRSIRKPSSSPSVVISDLIVNSTDIQTPVIVDKTNNTSNSSTSPQPAAHPVIQPSPSNVIPDNTDYSDFVEKTYAILKRSGIAKAQQLQLFQENILLNGEGSLITSDNIKHIYHLHIQLKALGIKLKIFGSFATRVALFLLNKDNPTLATTFPIHDIDLMFSTLEGSGLPNIHEFLAREKFIDASVAGYNPTIDTAIVQNNTFVNVTQKFSKVRTPSAHGLKINLLAQISDSYESNKFSPFHYCHLEIVDDDEETCSTSDRITEKIHNIRFKLVIEDPKNSFPDLEQAVIEAACMQKMRVRPPYHGVSKYSFLVFKSALKFSDYSSLYAKEIIDENLSNVAQYLLLDNVFVSKTGIYLEMLQVLKLAKKSKKLEFSRPFLELYFSSLASLENTNKAGWASRCTQTLLDWIYGLRQQHNINPFKTWSVMEWKNFLKQIMKNPDINPSLHQPLPMPARIAPATTLPYQARQVLPAQGVNPGSSSSFYMMFPVILQRSQPPQNANQRGFPTSVSTWNPRNTKK